MISEQQLEQALEEQRGGTQRLGEVLVRLGFVTEEEILDCLSTQLGYPSIDLRDFSLDDHVARLKRLLSADDRKNLLKDLAYPPS